MTKPTAKFFKELTTTELYEILKARAQVFILEQEICYQDMDDIDYDSLHLFYLEDGRISAYMRVFPIKDELGGSTTVHMGRVLTVEHGKGLGGKLLHESIGIIREKLHAERICMDAQSYAVGFYEREGFAVISDEFLEEGIMHRKMELKL